MPQAKNVKFFFFCKFVQGETTTEKLINVGVSNTETWNIEIFLSWNLLD